LITVLGKRKLHIAKVGKVVRTAFVSSNLPASLKNEEKVTNLLSHLVARGQKSAVVGLVKLKGRPK
jgi:hypothetical protein